MLRTSAGIQEREESAVSELFLHLVYDHQEIYRAVEQQNLDKAMALWQEKCRKLDELNVRQARTLLDSLSQVLLSHALSMQRAEALEYRHRCHQMIRQLKHLGEVEPLGNQMIQWHCKVVVHQDKETSHIQMACQYVQTHLEEPFTLETVAKHIFVSKCYLCRIFRSQTGMSFSHYVTEQRMKKAEQLLRHSNLNIDRIAEECGYTSATYFATNFRKYKGVSPSAFRRQLGQGESASTET